MLSRTPATTATRRLPSVALMAAAIIMATASALPSPAMAGGSLIQAPRNANPEPNLGGRVLPQKRLSHRACRWLRGYGEGRTQTVAQEKARQHLFSQIRTFGPHIVLLQSGYSCRTIEDIGHSGISCQIRWQLCPA